MLCSKLAEARRARHATLTRTSDGTTPVAPAAVRPSGAEPHRYLLHCLAPHDLPGAELTAAVQTVAAGGLAMSPEITNKLVSREQSRNSMGFDGMRDKIATLTDSEREVLALIGAGHNNTQIAETLHLSLASIKSYVSRIMMGRLGLDNRTQAAVLAHEAGMVVARQLVGHLLSQPALPSRQTPLRARPASIATRVSHTETQRAHGPPLTSSPHHGEDQ
ncbi:response regulator transcription factor [Streptomyces sp. NPDC006704]|uniref:helix-turn-helix transcriptional regulator n=1 Tax=Streptomyces sp. NPDC006704 TaxID=3364760 RepID=UPI0036BCB3C9